VPGDIALLSPTNTFDAVELSRTLFRKRVLPIGTINYHGRQINFDRGYLRDLTKSFREGAFDQVPFLLAKDDNAHTMDPERFRGEVKGLELTDGGLDVLLDLTPDAAELVRQNPKLGVSARIIEGLERAVDGRKFSRALQHVLGTLDPKVTGMGSWQEVSLSEEVNDTIDITNEEVTTLSDTSTQAPPVTANSSTTATPVVTTTTANTPQPPAPPLVSQVEDEDDGVVVDEGEEMSDEELAALASEFSNGDARQDQAIEMLHAQDKVNAAQIAQLQLELSRQRWVNEARLYIDAGVPPVLVQLAGQVLALPAPPVIELSNREKLDFGVLMRDMLEQTKGFIQLSQEAGSTFGSPDDQQSREDAILQAWEGGK
jgi:hypothetical protein